MRGACYFDSNACRALSRRLSAAKRPVQSQAIASEPGGKQWPARANAVALDQSDPTAVPRIPGIKDGKWRPADEQLVKKALEDAVPGAQSLPGMPTVLLGQTVKQLQELASSQFEQPKYRGKQLYDSLFHGVTAVQDINQVPKSFREELVAAGVTTGRSRHHDSVVATDGTRKLLRQLADGRVVETVGIPNDDYGKSRLTACVSSQVGCPMRCTFCATGKGGYARNLLPHEIVDQVLAIQEDFGKRVSNVVFMGMGEPMLNMDNVVEAVAVINKQLGIGARSITISTVGVKGQLRKLAQKKLQCVLAVSLHAPNQDLRQKLVPSAKAYPISELLNDCTAYFQATSRRVTFEYTLLKGVNNSPEQASELGMLLKRHHLATHVNLIPWNVVEEGDFERPSKGSVQTFQKVLEKHGISVSVRVTRGLDAAAACGQLRNAHQKQALQDFQQLG